MPHVAQPATIQDLHLAAAEFYPSFLREIAQDACNNLTCCPSFFSELLMGCFHLIRIVACREFEEDGGKTLIHALKDNFFEQEQHTC